MLGLAAKAVFDKAAAAVSSARKRCFIISKSN